MQRFAQRHGLLTGGRFTDDLRDVSFTWLRYSSCATLLETMLADPSTSMSAAYGMLGHGGMQHPTQDGHAFMLLDAKGRVLWHQAYSQMYVDPSQLLADMGPMA